MTLIPIDVLDRREFYSPGKDKNSYGYDGVGLVVMVSGF